MSEVLYDEITGSVAEDILNQLTINSGRVNSAVDFREMLYEVYNIDSIVLVVKNRFLLLKSITSQSE